MVTESLIRLTERRGRIKTGLSTSEFHFLLLPFIKRAAVCHYTVISVKYIIKLQRTRSALPRLLHKVDSAVKNAIKFDVITATNCPIFFYSCWFQDSWWSRPVYFTLPASWPRFSSPSSPATDTCSGSGGDVSRRLFPRKSDEASNSPQSSAATMVNNWRRLILNRSSSRKEQDPKLNYKKDISVQETKRWSEGTSEWGELLEKADSFSIFTLASRVDLGSRRSLIPPSNHPSTHPSIQVPGCVSRPFRWFTDGRCSQTIWIRRLSCYSELVFLSFRWNHT